MASAYFAPLVTLPDIIDKPGAYITRSGETVRVDTVTTLQSFGCTGEYPDGTPEGWHKSGRLYAGFETPNDIVCHA